MPFEVEVILRLMVAVVLGGLIGYERENTNRPAGFRTHILVCVGAALVVVTSQYLIQVYPSITVDPTRLGAQVISGIGFLGAGTIIRDGFNVRGLTTAASLWAVSCVGIAVGSGFYVGAAVATLFIFLTLIILKKAEKHFSKRNLYRTFIVEYQNVNGLIGHVNGIFESQRIEIKNIRLNKGEENEQIMTLLVKLPGSAIDLQILSDIQSLEGVKNVYEE